MQLCDLQFPISQFILNQLIYPNQLTLSSSISIPLKLQKLSKLNPKGSVLSKVLDGWIWLTNESIL